MANIVGPPALNKPRLPRTGLSPRGMNDSLSEYVSNGYGASPTVGSGAASVGGFVPSSSPFTDLSNLSIPEDPQEMFKLCKFLAIWSPVHKAFVRNMACLPATDPVIKSKRHTPRRGQKVREERTDSFAIPEDALTDRVRTLLDDHLRLKKFNQRVGVQFWTYSSSVVQIHFPFIKMLTCPDCTKTFRADQSDWELKEDGRFEACCIHCNSKGPKMVTDRYIRSPHDVKLSVPDMSMVHTLKSGAGDDVDVYLKIDSHTIERLRSKEYGDRAFILRQPQAYIEAALGLRRYGGWMSDKPFVKLRDDQFYLMRNVHLEFAKHGLPMPAFLSSLKDYWQMRQLQRASESISNLHIYPLDIVYPESSARSGNLFEMINVANYMDVIRGELAQHRQDPNYRPVMPFPVASTRVGGDGKALLLSSEIRVYMEILCAALECPIEFIFGGLSYSGSDVSIQQMIKKLEDYRADLLAMNKWVVRRICEVMGWPDVIVEFDEFRLGQDLPFIQMIASLKGQYAVGTRRLHRLLRIDTESERQDIREDVMFEMELQRNRMKLDARTQQEIMLRQTMGQAEGQVKGQETMLEEAKKLAERVRSDPQMYQHVMASPELAASIFGPNSAEVSQLSNRAIQSETPQTPIPQMVAPQAAADQSAQMTLDAVDPQAVKMLLGDFVNDPNATPEPSPSFSDDDSDYVARLVRMFGNVDPMHWPGMIQQIQDDMGMDIATAVQSQLYMGQAYMGDRSVYAKGHNRAETRDYGSNF